MRKLFFTILFALTAAGNIFAQSGPSPRLVQSFGMYPGSFAGKSGANLNGKFVTDSLGTLMISDGTDTGTKSIYSFYALEAMLVVNGKLFMIACDSSLGIKGQLWISDGTTAGTHIVKNIGDTTSSPGGVLYFNFSDYSLIEYNNDVYFYGNDSIHGVELWKSDGTDTGTVMVRYINTIPGANILDLTNYPFGMLKVANNKLFFAANDGIHGPELWCTDGTSANTNMVKDLWPGAQGANPQFFTTFNDKLCFWAYSATDTGLYITDGTDTGTKLLINGIMTPNSEQAILNGKLYFFADSIYAPYGTGLWATDGTQAGTKWVSHAFYSVDQYSYASYLSSFLTSYNDKLYFGAAGNLWVSDGTDTGTQLLKVFETEAGLCCTPTNITAFNGKMYMRVKDFSGMVEICESDGTDTGTAEVAYPGSDFETTSSIVPNNYLCMPLTVVGTKLFFWNTYLTESGHSLYVIDLQDESVKTIHTTGEIKVYPNPASDVINIEAPGTNKINKIEVLNMSGQLLITQWVNGQNNAAINLKENNDKILIIKTYTDNGTFNNKIVSFH